MTSMVFGLCSSMPQLLPLLTTPFGPYQWSRSSISMDLRLSPAWWLQRQPHGSCPPIPHSSSCIAGTVSAPSLTVRSFPSKHTDLCFCICNSTSRLSQTILPQLGKVCLSSLPVFVLISLLDQVKACFSGKAGSLP